MANVPPPKGLTRAESKELNRRKLIQSARELIVQTGYGALSARQVSAHAGVAQSSFYAHFTDKEHLVRELSSEIFSRLREALRESRQETITSWEEMISLTFMRLMEFFVVERDVVAILFAELDQRGSPLNDIGQAIFDTLHQDFTDDITRLIALGRIPPMPVDGAVSMIIGTCVYVLRRILNNRVEDPMAVFQEIARLNRALVRGLELDAREA